MAEQQNTQTAPAEAYLQNAATSGAAASGAATNSFPSRAQLRHERQMAKFTAKEQHRETRAATREAHRAARAARPRRDWTFEVRAGEKLYTFTWRWHPLGFESQVIEPEEQPGTENPYQESSGE